MGNEDQQENRTEAGAGETNTEEPDHAVAPESAASSDIVLDDDESPNENLADDSHTSRSTNEQTKSFAEIQPIVLSETGWASDHQGLLKLVADHLDEYQAELQNGMIPATSLTVRTIIDKLLATYSPAIFAVDHDHDRSTQPSDEAPRPLPLDHDKVQPEGSHFSQMAHKVHECYLLVQERRNKDSTLNSHTPECNPDYMDDDLDPDSFSLQMKPPGTRPRKYRKRVPGPASRRSHRTVRSTAASKPNPYAKSYGGSGEEYSETFSSTPKRKARHDNDETPQVTNRGKRHRGSSKSGRISLTLPPPLDVELPVVRVEDLCYDWSSLKLDGTAAWNKLLVERTNPAISNIQAQVTPMDTYQLMQNLRDGLRTPALPKDSPLHKGFKDVNKGLAACSPSLKPVFPEMTSLFRNMVKFDSNEDKSRRYSYHHKTPEALQEHLVEIDRHGAELKARQAQLAATHPQAPSRLPEIIAQAKARRRAKKMQQSPQPKTSAPVFWQENFTALLQKKTAATNYLMIQDQY